MNRTADAALCLFHPHLLAAVTPVHQQGAASSGIEDALCKAQHTVTPSDMLLLPDMAGACSTLSQR